MKGSPFYKVRVEDVEAYGLEAAFLYAVLKSMALVRPKDESGYFTVRNSTLVSKTHLHRRKMRSLREMLATAGLISYEAGRNQNCPCRYKINH